MTHAHKFLVSFAYPATLGAGLAWWVQGLATYSDGSIPAPSLWILAFGVWFLFYHSIWYWFLVTAADPSRGAMPAEYGALALTTDFVDVIAMMLGFAALGLASGNYDKSHPTVAFYAVLLVAVSAAIANFPIWWKSKGRLRQYVLPFALAIGIPSFGAYVQSRSQATGTCTAWTMLGLLYVVLLLYLVRPDLFSSHRSPRAAGAA